MLKLTSVPHAMPTSPYGRSSAHISGSSIATFIARLISENTSGVFVSCNA